MNQSTDANAWAALFQSLVVLQSTPRLAVARIKIDGSLPAFAGHFPGDPILPAIALLEFSLHLARAQQWLGPSPLAEVKDAKFLGPVRPHDLIEISYSRVAALRCAVTWSVVSEADLKKCAEFELVLS